MKPEENNFVHSWPGRRWLALLCVLLLVAAVGAQSLHLHPDELAPDGKHCPLCQVAHAAVQIVSIVQLHVAMQAAGYLFVPANIDRKLPSDSTPLFSRPPPALV